MSKWESDMYMCTSSEEALDGYLLYHESDIANEINDFGDLRGIFYDIFNRFPSEFADDYEQPGRV
jgi:hypothetical protein